jgi:HD-like signal output (HDOD) protein
MAFRPDKTIVTASVSIDPSERALRCLGQLPPFSPMLTRLMASLAREDVAFSAVAELIEKDTVLAGNVLRLVNSALYGRRGTVNSVRHAVALLGITKLRNTTLTMSVTRLWRHVKTPEGWSMAQFNLHSVAVAILADLLSQHKRVQYPEGAFTAGLFHDLGRLLIAIGLPDDYIQVLTLSRTETVDPEQLELRIVGSTHADLSAQALAIWNLPQAIQVAVRYHHSPALDPTPLKPGEMRLSELIRAADRYVNQSVLSVDAATEACAPGEDPLADLDLGEKLPNVLEDFKTEFAAIKEFF